MRQEKIKKEYLAKLKRICDELELKPVGFLVVAEAVAHLLEKEEGAPITAILAEIGDSAITVSLIKAGRLMETKAAEIHKSAPFTVDVLLKHFEKAEILPSRIVLLDSASEELAQEFIGFAWSKSLPFLHLPQISTLPPNFDSKAVLAGGAGQMGFVLPPTIDKFFGKSPEIEPMEMVESTVSEIDEGGQLPHTTGEKKEDEFGFMAEEDIAKDDEAETAIVSDNLTLGQKIEEIPSEVKLEGAQKKSFAQNAGFITAGFRKFVDTAKKMNFDAAVKGAPAFARSGRAKFMAIPGILLILLIFILFIYFFKTQAVITLGITPKDNSKDQSATFSVGGSTDSGKRHHSGRNHFSNRGRKTNPEGNGQKSNRRQGKRKSYNCLLGYK